MTDGESHSIKHWSTRVQLVKELDCPESDTVAGEWGKPTYHPHGLIPVS